MKHRYMMRLIYLHVVLACPMAWSMSFSGISGQLHSYDGKQISVSNQSFTVLQPAISNKHKSLTCRRHGMPVRCDSLRNYKGRVHVHLDAGVATDIELLD